MNDLKKLAFYEIGGGELFKEVQSAFEQAQITAKEENDTVVITLKIAVLAPEVADGRFGHLKFAVGVKNPERKSAMLTTELRDGLIVNTGESMDDILQTSLEFPGTIHSFAEKKASAE